MHTHEVLSMLICSSEQTSCGTNLHDFHLGHRAEALSAWPGWLHRLQICDDQVHVEAGMTYLSFLPLRLWHHSAHHRRLL